MLWLRKINCQDFVIQQFDYMAMYMVIRNRKIVNPNKKGLFGQP